MRFGKLLEWTVAALGDPTLLPVIPPSSADHQYTQDKLILMVVKETPTSMYGKCSLTLNLGL